MPPTTNISYLPGDVVSDILSRLPTDDAVRTSVLSRTWKYKWTSIYNIDIDHTMIAAGLVNLIDAVTKVLSHTKTSRLKNFRLSSFYHSSYIEKWMSDALMRNVQILDISVYNSNTNDSICFSGWGLLTELRLKTCCTLKVPLNNCFPNLKLLWLCGHVSANIKIVTTVFPDNGSVILGFPVLEVLRLKRCQWPGVSSVEIQAPELIMFSSSCSDKNCDINICGPKLVMFESTNVNYGIVNNFVLNTPAVTYVCLSNPFRDETSALHTLKVLTKFLNMKCLRITGSILQALLHQKPMVVSSSFDQLKELEICYILHIEDVLEFLRVSPHLESLILNLKYLPSGKSESWEALSPNTLAQLKEVKLLNVCCRYQDRYLPMYLLKNAKNLKKMTIRLRKMERKKYDQVEFIKQSFLGLKPKSSSCEIVVEEEKEEYVQWAGSWPKVITGDDGRATQIVQYRREL